MQWSANARVMQWFKIEMQENDQTKKQIEKMWNDQTGWKNGELPDRLKKIGNDQTGWKNGERPDRLKNLGMTRQAEKIGNDQTGWKNGERPDRLKKGQNWFLGLRHLRPAAKNACIFCQCIFSRFILDFDRTLCIIQVWIAIGIGSEQKTVLGTVVILAVKCHILKSNFCEKQYKDFVSGTFQALLEHL